MGQLRPPTLPAALGTQYCYSHRAIGGEVQWGKAGPTALSGSPGGREIKYEDPQRRWDAGAQPVDFCFIFLPIQSLVSHF